MDAYANLASVYDEFMDNVPYEEWAEYLHGLFEEYQITDGLMCELGCGTGSMTELMADYDKIRHRLIAYPAIFLVNHGLRL